MTRGSEIESIFVLLEGILQVFRIFSTYEAVYQCVGEVIETRFAIRVTWRSELESSLVVNNGVVQILEIPKLFKTRVKSDA